VVEDHRGRLADRSPTGTRRRASRVYHLASVPLDHRSRGSRSPLVDEFSLRSKDEVEVSAEYAVCSVADMFLKFTLFVTACDIFAIFLWIITRRDSTDKQ